MAVHIIGENPTSDETLTLPTPEVQLPGPETVPAARRVWTPESVAALLEHPSPLIRGFAVEQATALADEGLDQALIRRIRDDDLFVFSQALAHLARRKVQEAVEPVAADLAEARGERAAALATALGRIAPKKLPEVIQSRGRIDDEAFPSVSAALAIAGGDTVKAFFKKALGRVGLLAPERQRALYIAVLILGDPKLCGRVLGEAIGDSNGEAPDGGFFPSRAAVASLGGLGIRESRLEGGEQLFDRAREVIEEDAAPTLPDEQREQLTKALARRGIGEALRALEPLTCAETRPASEEDDDLGTIPHRRQGLLSALIDRASDLEQLEPEAAAIFLVAAAQAAALIVSGTAPEATSPAMSALASALEVDAEVLVHEAVPELSTRLSALSPREMRRVHTIVAQQAFRRVSSLRRFVEAIARSGHGAGLVAATAEQDKPALAAIVRDGFADALEDAETTVLEVLDERPLDEKAARFALSIAEEIRTERVALAVGQRFFELRTIAKDLTAQVLLNAGDARFLPLLESRAFRAEPEEVAWALLSVATGAPLEGRIAETLERLEAQRSAEQEQELELELECDRCGERGRYGFDRAYIDPGAEGKWGDPAFVGDVRCKACGALDSLRPTEAGGRVLTQHMLQFLEAMQSGRSGRPVVTPSITTIGGETVGFAEALRRLNKLIDDAPSTIRHRLERARLRMILKRDGLHEDLAAIRAEDPDAVEATIIEATTAARDRNMSAALSMLVAAHARLLEPSPPRLYDAESTEALRTSVEGLLLELSDQGVPVPQSVDLEPARERRKAHEAKREDEASSSRSDLQGKRSSGRSRTRGGRP